jgi:hypothetical protein
VNPWFSLLLAVSAMLLSGCNVDFSTRSDGRNQAGPVISEGTIYSVTYEQADGKPTTISRASFPPEGGGTWNVDAYGTLTAQALVITYPGRRELGPHIIPFDRVVEVRFGDGGIQNPGLGSHADHSEHASDHTGGH